MKTIFQVWELKNAELLTGGDIANDLKEELANQD